MASQQVSLQSNVKGYYTGTQASIEALTGVPDGSIAFGWTTDPSDGEFGIYNGVVWTWGTGSSTPPAWGDITGTLADQTDLQTALDAKIPASYLDTDGTLAANSDLKIATQKATRTYVSNAVTGLLEFKGSTDCSANPNYPAAAVGDAYVVSVAGKIGGASGKSVDVGDVYVAKNLNSGGTEASVGADWFVLEHNLQGALLAANNLSDLASVATAKTNLAYDGGEIAFTATSDLVAGWVDEAIEEVYAYARETMFKTGWIAQQQTFTFAAADDPVYQVYVSGNVTANTEYKLGNKIKLSNNSTTFYGFIVKVGAYDSGNNRTPVDLYGGTDYDIANSPISAVYISRIQNPEGFPLSPAKWTVTTTDSSDRTQSSPVTNTWYNPGSLSLSSPIGVWNVSYKVLQRVARAASTLTNMTTTLSTANNSETDADFSNFITLGGASGSLVLLVPIHCLPKVLSLTTKTSYFLNCRTTGGADSIGHRGDVGTTVIRAVCAYL